MSRLSLTHSFRFFSLTPSGFSLYLCTSNYIRFVAIVAYFSDGIYFYSLLTYFFCLTLAYHPYHITQDGGNDWWKPLCVELSLILFAHFYFVCFGCLFLCCAIPSHLDYSAPDIGSLSHFILFDLLFMWLRDRFTRKSSSTIVVEFFLCIVFQLSIHQRIFLKIILTNSIAVT